MKINLLMTGASGIIGRLLLEDLSHKKINVFAISSQYKELKKEFNADNFQFFSLEQFYANEIDFGKIDIVLHMAFARTQIGSDLAKSIDFTRDIFCKAKEFAVKNIIHISSQGIYGDNRDRPSLEDDIVNPFDLYSVAKYACEQLGNEICAGSRTKIIHIRLASLLAPSLEQRIVNKMLKSALLNNEIKIIGGKQIFSYLDARDAAKALACLIFSKLDAIDTIYNLGIDYFYNIHNIAETIQEVITDRTGKNVKISLEERDINTQIKLNSSKFEDHFGWQAKYNLKNTIEWILQENN